MTSNARSSPPRLTILITEFQELKLKEIFEHGDRKKVFNIIIDDLISLYDTYGLLIVPMLLERRVSYKNMMEDYLNASRRPTNS